MYWCVCRLLHGDEIEKERASLENGNWYTVQVRVTWNMCRVSLKHHHHRVHETPFVFVCPLRPVCMHSVTSTRSPCWKGTKGKMCWCAQIYRTCTVCTCFELRYLFFLLFLRKGWDERRSWERLLDFEMRLFNSSHRHGKSGQENYLVTGGWDKICTSVCRANTSGGVLNKVLQAGPVRPSPAVCRGASAKSAVLC